MNHQEFFKDMMKYTTWELLTQKVTPVPAKQPNNHKFSHVGKEKFCIRCHDRKPLTEFTYVLKKNGTPRKDKRARVCNECLKTQEGREMETYKVSL